MAEKVCEALHKLLNDADLVNRYHYDDDFDRIPKHGVYFIFERGEFAHGSMDRIVRIGTHTGINNLRKRIKEHYITENKDRSIFRKNVGRAIINQTGDDQLLADWNINITKRVNKEQYPRLINNPDIQAVENQVSDYIINNTSFAVIPLMYYLSVWEQKLIATVSLCKECKGSDRWLGELTPIKKIRDSGLWLVQHVFDKSNVLQEDELEYIRSIIIKYNESQ